MSKHYCSFCRKEIEMHYGGDLHNIDTWFCIMWCKDHEGYAPQQSRYDCDTGKLKLQNNSIEEPK